MNNLYWALVLGILAAVALPIGALMGIAFKPSHRVSGSFAGFGAGALFAALALELVAPVLLHTDSSEAGTSSSVVLLAAAAIGGILFMFFNFLLDKGGGYLRKTATSILYIGRNRNKHARALLKSLSKFSFFNSLPPDHIHSLVEKLHRSMPARDEIIFKENEPGDHFYIIEKGKIRLTLDGSEIATLMSGDVFGEIALITDDTRTATATATTKPCFGV